MDAAAIYVPIAAVARLDDQGEEISRPAALVALERASGATRWTYPIAGLQPPVVTPGSVFIASDKGIHALDPTAGEQQWVLTLAQPVRAPMLASGNLLVTLLEGNELVAIDVGRRQIAWRHAIGESDSVLMTADEQAVYLVMSGSRVQRVLLADGSRHWERRLEGELSEPTVDRGRLYVGSDANRGSLWALDVETGRDRGCDRCWKWSGGVIGGPVIGVAVAGETVYLVARDMMIRALNRGNGNQRWHKAAGTRPLAAPAVLDGVITVPGDHAPRLSTFRADTGAPVSTWAGPDEKVLMQGPPLIDQPTPLGVSLVVLFRNGLIVGLTPTAMLFKEPALGPLPVIPGRELPRER
jgi:outer membrane protein assembly factor BamB